MSLRQGDQQRPEFTPESSFFKLFKYRFCRACQPTMAKAKRLARVPWKNCRSFINFKKRNTTTISPRWRNDESSFFELNCFLNIFPQLSRIDGSFSLVQYKPVINVTGNYYLKEYQFYHLLPKISVILYFVIFTPLSSLSFD